MARRCGVGGIPEGTVKHIALPKRPDQKVTVEMNLQHSTQNVLKRDSIASAPPLVISDLIQKTNDILDTTKGTMQNVEASADNLKSISAKINQGQ